MTSETNPLYPKLKLLACLPVIITKIIPVIKNSFGLDMRSILILLHGMCLNDCLCYSGYVLLAVHYLV